MVGSSVFENALEKTFSPNLSDSAATEFSASGTERPEENEEEEQVKDVYEDLLQRRASRRFSLFTDAAPSRETLREAAFKKTNGSSSSGGRRGSSAEATLEAPIPEKRRSTLAFGSSNRMSVINSVKLCGSTGGH